MTFVLNVAVSAMVIAFASWLSGRLPAAAGFLVAMPLATLLVLPLSYRQHGDVAAAVLMARSIFLAIPVTLTFFVPFLLQERLGLGFWQAYLLGCAALPLGWLAHRVVVRALFA